jgi:hypothetical protein
VSLSLRTEQTLCGRIVHNFSISLCGDFLDAQRSKISKAAAIQEAALKSLTKLLRPLSALIFDCGLSISEVNLIFRTATVQTAAMRQLENSNRVNISGISALTGVPRAEVSRILNSSPRLTGAPQGRQSIASRILSAWHCDSDYLTAGHRPRGLKIFGRGTTFESLVKTYGRGIPIRAILDELNRMGAIQLLTSSQKILPKMSLAINSRITYKRIRVLDATANDLLECLLSPSDSVSVEKVSGTKAWSGRGPLVRRKFGPKAIALIQEMQTRLASRKAKHRPENAQKVAHLRVKIVYCEAHAQLVKHSPEGRRNFHRNR